MPNPKDPLIVPLLTIKGPSLMQRIGFWWHALEEIEREIFCWALSFFFIAVSLVGIAILLSPGPVFK